MCRENERGERRLPLLRRRDSQKISPHERESNGAPRKIATRIRKLVRSDIDGSFLEAITTDLYIMVDGADDGNNECCGKRYHFEKPQRQRLNNLL